jgi:adenylate kinase
VKKSFEGKRFNQLKIGITGSPGTGKKTVARALSHLTGLKVISLNRLAISTKSGKRFDSEFLVNIRELRQQRIPSGGKIIVGHLLPLVIPKSAVDFVAVLRCSPGVLRRRYMVRDYSEEKIKANIQAEVLDLVSYSALRKFGRKKVSEFDTTRSKNPSTLARQILETIQGKRPKLYSVAKWSERASKSDKILLRMMGKP